MRRKGIVIMLLLGILLPIICVAPRVQAAEVTAAQSDLRVTIEQQIRAYADSIDFTNANDEAAWALVGHAMRGNGDTLYVDENHELTATLLNSEMLQDCLITGLPILVAYMQDLQEDVLYANGGCSWYSTRSSYHIIAYSDPDHSVATGFDTIASSAAKYGDSGYTGKMNAYDSSLEWLVGTSNVSLTMRRGAVSSETVTYNVTLVIGDDFNFNAEYEGNDRTFQKILGILGSSFGQLLIDDFKWYATAEFQLTVPYFCSHKVGAYHWTYDTQSSTLNSDSSGGYTNNSAQQFSYINNAGNTQYYHRLESTVRLMHTQPWVLEYSTRSPGHFVFAPLEQVKNMYPNIMNFGRSALWIQENNRDDRLWYRYGSALSGNFEYSAKEIFTIRLENVINQDGSNMVYLTVYNADLQQTVFGPVPMDDHYISESGSTEGLLIGDGYDWVSGKDILINYIGNASFRFHANYFDLKIWENGSGNKDDWFLTEEVEPTCSTPGGVRHTCQACGYTYYSDETPALGHDWGAYKSNNNATCQKDGTKTAACKTCGEKKTVTDEGSRADHDWTAATCLYPQTCLTCGLTEGEVIGHNWVDATCTEPKKCTMCGLTEGKALGHKWSGSTCEHANTCNVCGSVSGEPKAHTWVEATCTSAKRCSFCGTVDGEPLGHDFVGGSCTAGPVCSRCGGKDAAFGHQWTAADCYSARTCSVCGFADGEAMGHSWIGPTCTEAKYCGVCGIVEGEPLGHIFADATCDTPRTCTGCELTEGEPLGHDWIDADCENPRHCTRCAATEGEPLGHSWVDASCAAPKTCGVCGKTEGIATDHSDSDGDLACDHCGLDLRVPAEPTEPPATTAPTQTPTTEPSVTKPDNGEEKAGNGLIWIICGIALAAIGAVSAGLILRKRKNG